MLMQVQQLCFLSGIGVGGIKVFPEVLLPPTDYIVSGGHQLPIPTMYSVDEVLLSPPESLDNLTEFLQG